MSIFQDRALTCPHCEYRSTHSVAVSLDGERARAEGHHQAILDDSFQRMTCEACSGTFRADGPLVYLDVDARLWLGVFPAPWEAAWWEHEDVEPQAPGFAVRAVFGLDQLREKLVAHDAGIDDRVLEAYKLDLLRGLGPYELGPSARPRLRAATSDDAVFHVPRPEPDALDRRAVVRVERAEIDRVAAGGDADWAYAIQAVSSGPYVDLGRIFAPRPS